MRPDKQLAGLLGLTDAGTHARRTPTCRSTPAPAPGAGIVGQTMQFHGTADRYTLNGATSVATLYSNATTATANPAVTLRSVGSDGGQAAAFTYDLARSVVYTRQGNPAWAGQERDGAGADPLRRPVLRAKPGDVQPDWVDLNKVAIPQADEQQRLLANLIGHDEPRPQAAAALLVPAARREGGRRDDRRRPRQRRHRAGASTVYKATARPAARSPTGSASAAPPTSTRTRRHRRAGGGLSARRASRSALHVDHRTAPTGRRRRSRRFYADSARRSSRAKFPSLPPPATNRTHCIAWSDWATQPKVELEPRHPARHELLLLAGDLGQGPPGLFTGSGMPMRFADLDGSMIDVYQAATQMTDESGQTYPFTVDTLLDSALGPEGYYGVFTANMHTDNAAACRVATRSSPRRRRAACRSSRPSSCSTWLDGRNGSSFNSISWSGNTLDFTVAVGAGANGLQAMLPTHVGGRRADRRHAQRQSPSRTTTQTIKGVEYAFFDARRRQLRGELRRRRHRAGDLRTSPSRTRRRHGDVTWTPTSRRTRASTTAPTRRARPQATSSVRARHLAHVPLTRPRTEHDVLLPRDLGRRAPATPRPSPPAARAATLHHAVREPSPTPPPPTSPPGPGRQHVRLRDRGRRGHPDAAVGEEFSAARRCRPAGRLHLGTAGRRGRRQRHRLGRRARTSTAPSPAPPRPTRRAARSSSSPRSAAAIPARRLRHRLQQRPLGDLQHQGDGSFQRPHQQRREPAGHPAPAR